MNGQMQAMKERVLRWPAARSAAVLLVLVGALWAIELVDLVTPRSTLDWYGIHPRTLLGLRNILLAPLLHAGFGHLLANTLPLIILGALIIVRSRQDFISVTLMSVLVSGLGVWLFGGGNTVHIGASGVVFGYLGYLLARAWFERSAAALLLGLAALVLYGGALGGVLPRADGVSWLAHLFGLAGGAGAAWLLVKRPTRPARTA
jgi:membrane associated rhomboid family serine protease